METRFWSTIAQHRQPSITWSALPEDSPSLNWERLHGRIVLGQDVGQCQGIAFEGVGRVSFIPHRRKGSLAMFALFAGRYT
jgi:hypothetical protein